MVYMKIKHQNIHSLTLSSYHENVNIYRVLLHSNVLFMATILCVSYFYRKVKSIIYRSI